MRPLEPRNVTLVFRIVPSELDPLNSDVPFCCYFLHALHLPPRVSYWCCLLSVVVACSVLCCHIDVCSFIVVAIDVAPPDRWCAPVTPFYHFSCRLLMWDDTWCACCWILVRCVRPVATPFGSLTIKDWLPFHSTRSHKFEHHKRHTRQGDVMNKKEFIFSIFECFGFPMVYRLLPFRVSLFVSS